MRFKIRKGTQHWFLYSWREDPGRWQYLNYYDTFEAARAKTAYLVDMTTMIHMAFQEAQARSKNKKAQSKNK